MPWAFSKDPKVSWKNVPTRTVTAGDVTFAHRELGTEHPDPPVVCLIHLAAVLDNWVPGPGLSSCGFGANRPGFYGSQAAPTDATWHGGRTAAPGRLPKHSDTTWTSAMGTYPKHGMAPSGGGLAALTRPSELGL